VFYDQITNFSIFVMHPSIYFCVVPFISSMAAAAVCWLCFCFE